MALSANFNLSLKAMLTGAGDLGTPAAPVTLEKQILLASGTGVGQADQIFADTRTLAASATENLDLAGGLADPLGVTLTFAKIKAIIVTTDAANAADMTFGNAATNGFSGLFGAATHELKLPAGAAFAWIFPGAGKAVTAGTGDLFKVLAGAGSNHSYSIAIIGTSV